MRVPKPHYRKSHKCWYLKIKDELIRLDPDEKTAWSLYQEIMAQRQAGEQAHVELTGPNVGVCDILAAFLEWTEKHKAPATYQWYQKYCESFAKRVGKRLLVRDLKPFHVTDWLDACYAKANDNTRSGAITAVKR